MSALLPELTRLLAALFAAAAVAVTALAGCRLLARVHGWFQVRGNAFHSRRSSSGVVWLLRRTGVALLAAGNARWVPEKRLVQLARALRRAGGPSDLEPAELVAFMELTGIGFFALGVGLDAWLELGIASWFLAAAAGLCWPLIWLHDRIRHRHHLITRALPYNIDLLTLSVEAGLDFAAAVAKVVEKGRTGPLREELELVLKELKLGKTREEALRNLAARVGLASLTTFVNALVQADRMGTPLGRILRILATQMRVDRTHRAEKLANEAPVKLLLPLIAFIFPTVFIILFAPIAYSLFLGGSY